MRWTPPSGILVLLMVGGCGGPAPVPPEPPPVYSPGVVEEPITSVLLAALDADRRFLTVDSLWDPDASVVADGSPRYAPPRFAGIEAGGEVAITGSRLEVRQSLAWVGFDYRWISIRDGVAREAKATALLTPRENGGWKIVHLHTSTTRE
jgi:hypothetical protein